MKFRHFFYLFAFPLLFIACEKQDEAFVLPKPGNVELAQVAMGENYETQIFYHFEDNMKYSNHLYEWDLQFETAPNANLVRMNGGKQVQVFNTRSTNFNTVYSSSGVTWAWDSPDGNIDSAAFRDWYNNTLEISNNFIYLIDRGPDVSLNRYKKMQLLSVNELNYTFRAANLDGSEEKNYSMLKDTNYNYIYFTFKEGGKTVSIEPGKNNYDILFTRYRYIYYDLIPVLPYSVNGVLINPYNTVVAADSIVAFDSIDYAYARTMSYSSKFDAIGFDWKAYNFNSSVYEVNPKKCYVLRNQDGFYFKFRFINFYDSQGIKGSPEFEFQRL
jgi:hypothetical protein